MYLFDKTTIILSLSDFYYRRKYYDKAIQYGHIGLAIRKNKQPVIKKGFYNILYKAYLETNQIDSSKYFSNLYATVNDSLKLTTDSGLNSTFERQNEANKLAHKSNIQQIIVFILIIISLITAYNVSVPKNQTA